MEIKVNVINEMKKLRSNTYSDAYSWVDELVQNCQRAKATHIDVEITDKHITVSDNGIGCSDPQILFDKSSSGWDESTTKAESPFGEGFFSTMIAADDITVKSIGFTATFDVEKMFRENNINAVDLYPNRKQSGFMVTLTNLRDNISEWRVIERFKDVGKYIKTPTMSINGEKVRYEGLNPDTKNKFMRKVNNEFFQGWIQPHSWRNGDWSEEMIKCFAFSRHIKDSKKYSGIFGVLNFKDNAVNLRCPDRKEFIFDSKYERMLKALESEINKMFTNIVKTGTDEDIRNFEYYIQRYTNVDEIKKFVKFEFIASDGDDEKLTNILTESDADEQPAESQEDSADEICGESEETTTENEEPTTKINIISTASPHDFSYEITETPISKANVGRPKQISLQTGKLLSDDTAYGFFINESCMDLYESQILIAKRNHIPLIKIRNGLERFILENDDRFQPISDISGMMSTQAEFRNMTPCTLQEIRMNKLLAYIAEKTGINKNSFVIADVEFSKVLTVNGTQHIISKIDKIATAYENKIYINRRHIKEYSDLTDDSDELTQADIRFIMLNLDTIASEMSHAVKETKDETIAHAESKSGYMMQIINAIFEKK